MNMYSSCPNRQSGSMLLEALIAVLIFSMGILAIVGLQAASIQASSDAKYRTEASFLANQLIGQMWVSNRTSTTLNFYFSSPAGSAYTTWKGTTPTPADGTVLATLPGAAANPPEVIITPSVGPTKTSSLVTVKIYWQAPNEAGTHQYIAIAQII